MGHWEMEPASGKLSWSDEIYRIFDLDPARFDASFEAFIKMVHPDDRDFVSKAYYDSLKNRTKYDVVHRILLADGREKYIHEQCRTDYDHKGRPVRSLGTVHDITAIKEAEEKLRKAKDEWERTFEAIGDIVTIQDTELRITRVNKMACEVLAAKPEELVGKYCYEVFRGVHEPCKDCPVVESLKDFQAHTGEIEHAKLGKTFMVSASPILDSDGKQTGIVHFARDITSQKQLENQLQQSQKMEAIGTLAGGIAHDFNNILTPILGFSAMAQESIAPDSPAAEEIAEVIKAAKRAADLVKQILTFSRQAEKEPQPLKVQYVIKEALKLLRASIPATIEIRQKIDTTCGAIQADPTQIHQVIMNLCTNAYHAMRESGGTLGVSLATVILEEADLINLVNLKPGQYIRLTINDTGHGMSKELLSKIFEPYFTTKAQGEGTGLGLSVVHGIVTSLGGEISVNSELGKGTTCQVYFPQVKSHDEEPPNKAAEPTLPRGEETILIVDDEEIIVTMEKAMLKSFGYKVATFTDPTEALYALEKDPAGFDLVITDMTMPKITGVELANKIFAIRKNLPVILCTGFSELISKEKAEALGISKFLLKPLSKSELAHAVREALDTGTGRID
jgi:PAS domain S-box-containing protein